jgi:D-mannonate dehydratase
MLMHVGGDYHTIMGGDITSKQNLEYNLRHGVKHLTVEVSNNPQGIWDLDELKRMRDNCDNLGVILEAIRMDSDFINKLRKGSERDSAIDTIVGNIRKAAQIGPSRMSPMGSKSDIVCPMKFTAAATAGNPRFYVM